MEQYLTLIQENIRPGIVKHEIDGDVKFEINGNFMRELRRKLFKGTDDEDAHEHVRRVLEIVELFHFPGITHDAVMLRVFPITLSGPALNWKNSLYSAGVLNHYIRLFLRTSIHQEISLTNSSERVKAKTKMDKKDIEEPVPRDLPVVQPYKAQEDEGDMDDGWDITTKDIERLRQILIPTIHTLPNLEPVVQPYMPQGPVRDEVKVVREKELEYDIPLQNCEM
ncbi:hypothetical protein Tco_0692913 [Tanacetum coccineum]